MNNIDIINKTVSMRNDICYAIPLSSKICDVNKYYVDKIFTPFEELRKGEKDIANTEDLVMANVRVRKNTLIRVKTLENQKRAGYILISSLTCFGTLILSTIIFIAIKLMLK